MDKDLKKLIDLGRETIDKLNDIIDGVEKRPEGVIARPGMVVRIRHDKTSIRVVLTERIIGAGTVPRGDFPVIKVSDGIKYFASLNNFTTMDGKDLIGYEDNDDCGAIRA